MLHIGILAHSADGAALCFLDMVREAGRRLGAHEHPEITLSILPMAPALERYERDDLASVRAHLTRTARRLADAGCDFFVCPDNTAHIALELPGDPLPLPGLHIAEIVAARATALGYSSIGLLGTKWTMEGPVYPLAFGRHGIAMRTPAPEDRALVDRVIFDELCQGTVLESSRTDYIRLIETLQREGCDAVALACTEIPLLITPEASPLPTLDSTRLLAEAAVDAAIADRVPAWRGGAVLPREAGSDATPGRAGVTGGPAVSRPRV
jgi:aspartate racemase